MQGYWQVPHQCMKCMEGPELYQEDYLVQAFLICSWLVVNPG